MSSFISYLISGISLGKVYMRSSPLVIPWYTESLKMLNFAHGDVIMVGSYVVLCRSQRHGIKSDFSHPAVHYHLYTHGRCDRRRCVSTTA